MFVIKKSAKCSTCNTIKYFVLTAKGISETICEDCLATLKLHKAKTTKHFCDVCANTRPTALTTIYGLKETTDVKRTFYNPTQMCEPCRDMWKKYLEELFDDYNICVETKPITQKVIS